MDFGKIIDFLSKPINMGVLIAVFLTSVVMFSLNFISEEILLRMKLLNFLDRYNYIIFIFLIASFFVLVIQIIIISFNVFVKKSKGRKIQKNLRIQREKLFNDPYAREILMHLYKSHPQPADLPYLNQKVKLLEQFDLIIRVNEVTLISPFETNNIYFAYVLQPIAEEMILENDNNIGQATGLS